MYDRVCSTHLPFQIFTYWGVTGNIRGEDLVFIFYFELSDVISRCLEFTVIRTGIFNSQLILKSCPFGIDNDLISSDIEIYTFDLIGEI